MMEYIIASTAVTDEICLADGKNIGKVAGGAGIYALCGIKLWCDDVLLVTGVGSDYKSIYNRWYEDNGISMDGLIVKDDKTPHTLVRYFEDGEREETPLYGETHYQKIEASPKDLEPYFQTAKGIYIFKNSNAGFWEEIISLKQNSNAVVMWEIANDATYFENREYVRRIAGNMEILSINISEARHLLGKETLDEMINEFKCWGLKLIFLRLGSKGALMITSSQVVEVPSMKDINVIDPTGGGNSSSGAVLYGYCEGYDIETCGKMGSISAAVCISQYGVPKLIDTEKYRIKLRDEVEMC